MWSDRFFDILACVLVAAVRTWGEDPLRRTHRLECWFELLRSLLNATLLREIPRCHFQMPNTKVPCGRRTGRRSHAALSDLELVIVALLPAAFVLFVFQTAARAYAGDMKSDDTFTWAVRAFTTLLEGSDSPRSPPTFYFRCLFSWRQS